MRVASVMAASKGIEVNLVAQGGASFDGDERCYLRVALAMVRRVEDRFGYTGVWRQQAVALRAECSAQQY